MRRRLSPDLLIILLLFALPLVMFWQQTVGGKTLLPTENLFQYEPFATYKEVAKAPPPQNKLVSDLVLENFQWKTFIRQSLAEREIPLWNPHQFSGIPFLAAGQQSTLYPFSILYYVLPLPAAYGWFTVVQLWLAGTFMYLFMRGLNVRRFGGVIAGVIYQLSAFFVISAVFPMIIAGAAWLPLILLAAEFIIQQRPFLRGRPASVPWAVLGAIALGCNILAGHVEITYYTLLITAYYAAARLILIAWNDWRSTKDQFALPVEQKNIRWFITRGAWLVAMVALGMGLGAIQFIPLFEYAGYNFRSDSASLQQVLGWAHPKRDVIQFALPNFYGNPAHHNYVDVFTGQTVPATVNAAGNPIDTIDWGIKNYVEGALYLGILPLALALYGLLDAWLKVGVRQTNTPTNPPYRVIFLILALVSLTFMFGLPTYAALYILPGISQLHSPFRWIFAVTLSVAVMAGFGAEGLIKSPSPKWTRRFGYGLAGAGIVILLALLASRIFFAQVEPLIDKVFHALAKAPEAFADARMFYSYEFTNVLVFGLMTLFAGVLFRWVGRKPPTDNVGVRHVVPGVPFWQIFAIALVAIDLMIASWGFNPASDPALLDFTPPAIQWLMQKQQTEGPFRYTTIDDPSLGDRGKIMNANMGWRYGLDDVRGYESIIPKKYVEWMERIAPQTQLEYNRIAPLYTTKLDEQGLVQGLYSWDMRALNVRYVISDKQTDIADWYWKLVYEDEAVRIWENRTYFPRAYTFPDDTAVDQGQLSSFDYVYETHKAAVITSDSGREKLVNVSIDRPSYLEISEMNMPGWRVFIRPQGGTEKDEKPLEMSSLTTLQSVLLPEAGDWTVRVTYSPASFQLGLFGTFISGILLVFVAGIYLWRLFVTPDEKASGVGVVAKNSLAPIILNLFNRGIDFGFAFIMLRILGPESSGIYFYAAFIFGWFDIFTNFGLNIFLTREVARDRSQAGRLLFNTSVLRVLLMGVGVILLVGFLTVRQNIPDTTPLLPEAVLAIALLYIGLVPNSLSTGLSALYYAFEKAEIPAAITTIATISKAVFGVAALALGFGVVGLAAVSIITNCITLAVMLWNARSLSNPLPPTSSPLHGEGEKNTSGRKWKPEWPLVRDMVGHSWPLMLNHFLASIFFQIDVVIIQAIHGDEMVGQYGVAYKWVSALNVIPAFFTMALLPVMSRQAHEDRAALKRNYALAIKMLVTVALPLAVIFTFLAYTLTGVLGGSEFLPDGAIATQFMIWSIPIGWINSLTQYVLIALDLQRRITWAFIIAVGFNIITNLIFIPAYGYRAAAIITILSEAMLLIPFAVLLSGAVGKISWFKMLWKPAAAAAAMVVVLFIGWPIQPFIALVVAIGVYGGLLLLLRPLDADEWARLAPLLPGRLKSLAPRTMAVTSSE
ncbi:MAG: oligosaccharide flippase family protein [Chloroflexota bacterium]